MKPFQKITIVCIFALFSSACAPLLPRLPHAGRPRPRPHTVVVTPGRGIPRAPKPKREVIPRAPYAGAVWIPGVWKWNGHSHIWVPGCYKANSGKSNPGKGKKKGHFKVKKH